MEPSSADDRHGNANNPAAVNDENQDPNAPISSGPFSIEKSIGQTHPAKLDRITRSMSKTVGDSMVTKPEMDLALEDKMHEDDDGEEEGNNQNVVLTSEIERASKSGSNRPVPGVDSTFVSNLYKMIDESSENGSKVVGWTEDGKSFFIDHFDDKLPTLIAKYFRRKNKSWQLSTSGLLRADTCLTLLLVFYFKDNRYDSLRKALGLYRFQKSMIINNQDFLVRE